jgi:predicted amidohydrolase YtcJ
LLAEQRMPTRWELDEAVPDRPVFIPRGGHVSTCNSLALERAGITDETPDPNGGVIVRRPADGKATGMLLDNANLLMRRVLPPPAPVERQMEWLAAHMARMNARGLVHATEPSIDQRALDVYRAMREAGRMTMRVDMLWRFYSNEDAAKVTGLADFAADDMLRFSGGKYMIDGGIEGAWLGEPYLLVEGEQSDPGYHGLKMLPPGGEDELYESFLAIAKAGLQVQCHAVGDAAIDAVLRVYSRVNDVVPVGPLRWAVMHVHLPSDHAIAEMKRLGVCATIQDHSVLLGANMLRWWGGARAAYAAPTRKLIDAGLLVSGGTDAPVVPNDPFLCLWWLVTRKTLHGEVLGGEQAISLRKALELYTINGARVIGVDDRQGSIEAGKLADLAVLSQDIAGVEPNRIRDTEVLLTLLGGRIVHDASKL